METPRKSKSVFAVELRSIGKAFLLQKQEVVAVRKVDAQVKFGDIIAITGRSGAGKSTLLYLIGTLDQPTSGEIWIDGTLVSQMNDEAVSAHRNASIGFVFQMSNLLPEFSALENVMMPGLIAGIQSKLCKERALQLLQAVGLGNRVHHRPSELSGGEQQRVAIARALVMKPTLLLCDEPTGNLDAKTSAGITDLLLKLCRDQNMTMLLVTHDLEVAAKLPKRWVMEDGSLVKVIS